MRGALRGVSEEPQRHFRAILEESQRSVMHLQGALEAPGRWQVRHLNTHLRSATEEPQRCLISRRRVQGPMWSLRGA